MDTLVNLLRAGAILGIIFFLFRMQTRRNRRGRGRNDSLPGRSTSTQGTPHGASSSKASLAKVAAVERPGDAAVRARLEMMELELRETSREVTAEVHTQVAILQRLTVDANLAAARLESALNRAAAHNRQSAYENSH